MYLYREPRIELIRDWGYGLFHSTKLQKQVYSDASPLVVGELFQAFSARRISKLFNEEKREQLTYRGVGGGCAELNCAWKLW